MKRANALLIFHLSYCFIINTYIYLEMLLLSQKYVRGSANVLRKMTGRTCQVLFTACGRELKNNLFGLLSSAYARKPTKLKNPQILKCQNPVIKCLDIHHLSEAIICEMCLHLPNVICPNTLRGWDLLWFKATQHRKTSWRDAPQVRAGQRDKAFQTAAQPQGSSAPYHIEASCITRNCKKPLSTQDFYLAWRSWVPPRIWGQGCTSI